MANWGWPNQGTPTTELTYYQQPQQQQQLQELQPAQQPAWNPGYDIGSYGVITGSPAVKGTKSTKGTTPTRLSKCLLVWLILLTIGMILGLILLIALSVSSLLFNIAVSSISSQSHNIDDNVTSLTDITHIRLVHIAHITNDATNHTTLNNSFRGLNRASLIPVPVSRTIPPSLRQSANRGGSTVAADGYRDTCCQLVDYRQSSVNFDSFRQTDNHQRGEDWPRELLAIIRKCFVSGHQRMHVTGRQIPEVG
ncbi:hypothetical protein LSH36_139g00005 [Paralvinella palmiformis]|uniref:Uncharacterized protein n=1 Tax=Paralvinella palmiformis TaxID=53620 RepID=A0AAD9N7M3_9ANNE|nr:hypothetical protein LSH36_139g00005 [Paralvinella palmiformis]